MRKQAIPVQAEPRVTFSKTKIRSLGLIPPTLADAFRDLVSGIKSWPFYLTGPPGTGKTCGVLALCDHVTHSEYITTADLASRLIDSYRTRERIWDDYAPFVDGAETRSVSKGARLVVLDELGVRQAVTDTQYESVHRLLDLRDHQPLIIVSNLTIAEVGRVYDARIASRCEAGTVLNLKGPDRRTA